MVGEGHLPRRLGALIFTEFVVNAKGLVGTHVAPALDAKQLKYERKNGARQVLWQCKW